jgi:hypothetical protein
MATVIIDNQFVGNVSTFESKNGVTYYKGSVILGKVKSKHTGQYEGGQWFSFLLPTPVSKGDRLSGTATMRFVPYTDKQGQAKIDANLWFNVGDYTVIPAISRVSTYAPDGYGGEDIPL